MSTTSSLSPKSTVMVSRRCRRQKAGYVSAVILFLCMLAFLSGMALLGTAQFQVRGANHSQNRMNGLILAESGVEDAILRLRSNPRFTGRTDTLYEDPATRTTVFGTFQTTVTTIGSQRRITSVGTTKSGTKMTVVAMAKVYTRALGDVAIMANGPINVSGTATVNSFPVPGLHISHVLSTDDINLGPLSFVDGSAITAGAALDVLGSSTPAPEEPMYYFPDVETTEDWRIDWISTARSGGSMPGITGSATVTAPKFIDGNITLNNFDSVKIKGDGIVYVNGNVSLSDFATLENGSTLVVSGTFTQSNASVYKATSNVTPTPTLAVYGTGYAQSTNVVTLTGNSGLTGSGIVYAINGSIKVAGNSTFIGALIAGGKGAGITVAGNYNHLFKQLMVSAILFPKDAKITGITEI